MDKYGLYKRRGIEICMVNGDGHSQAGDPLSNIQSEVFFDYSSTKRRSPPKQHSPAYVIKHLMAFFRITQKVFSAVGAMIPRSFQKGFSTSLTVQAPWLKTNERKTILLFDNGSV